MLCMGSRLLPLTFAAGALLADGAGAHQIASYLVLLAVIGAGAAAFVAVAAAIEGSASWAMGLGTSLGLALLLAGSVSRAGAPPGAGVPHVALSAVVAAIVLYALPLLGWVLEPLAPRRRAPQRARTVAAAPAQAEAA